MANALKREFFNVSRSDTFTIIPIGDVHIGAAACDEGLLKETVSYIKGKKRAYWIGMGDYLDAINVSDPRFDAAALAPWIRMHNLVDLAGAQMEHFLEIVYPIADRCLCLLTGNHEDVIKKYYERDVYSEMAARIKLKAGHPADYQIKLDYYGWLRLCFYNNDHSGLGSRATALDFNLHHGFGGGKLKGAKALQMERWIYTHNAEIVIFGHTHNADSYRAAVEMLDDMANVTTETRRGVYSGTYLSSGNGSSSTYAERKGYLPIPIGGVEIVLRPQAHKRCDMVRVIT